MDFRTRIANQMGALLLANLEGAQATEEAQSKLEGVKAVIAEKDAQIAALTPKPEEPAANAAPVSEP